MGLTSTPVFFPKVQICVADDRPVAATDSLYSLLLIMFGGFILQQPAFYLFSRARSRIDRPLSSASPNYNGIGHVVLEAASRRRRKIFKWRPQSGVAAQLQSCLVPEINITGKTDVSFYGLRGKCPQASSYYRS
ncbi:hypothetical protein EVAR_60486_1 [Eumeta japonica]|uniref:Uncharacterized protein n=1 Tax=Eumeta variegata TaxID=151549 RepID=A0A4C1ZQ52_EUMVA|nr:hypothetical protein EVAR_60486_1 [Eumeta japonica]